MGAFPPALLHTLITLPFYVLPTYYLAYYIVPRFLLTQQYLRATIHTIYLILFTAFGYILTSIAVIMMPAPEYFYMSGPNPLSIDLFIHLIGIFAVVFLVAAIRLFQLQQEVEHERLKAESALLKGQLHPHFLFNTLNNLYAQTLKKADTAPEMILKLSSLLDYTLYQTRHRSVPLLKEIEGVEAYIELEKIRFGDRLDLSFEIEGNVEGKFIAPLVFMPLVENAFKHGISRHDDQGWIHIKLRIHRDGCLFEVSNSYLGTSKDLDQPSKGIGLQNLRRRLELHYADQYEMTIQAEVETFTASLSLKKWEPKHVDS